MSRDICEEVVCDTKVHRLSLSSHTTRRNDKKPHV